MACYRRQISPILNQSMPVADSRGGAGGGRPLIDRMYLKTGENYAQKCTIFASKVQKFSGEGTIVRCLNLTADGCSNIILWLGLIGIQSTQCQADDVSAQFLVQTVRSAPLPRALQLHSGWAARPSWTCFYVTFVRAKTTNNNST